MLTSIEKNLLKTIKEQKLLVHGDRVLLAVSGGPDSVALLFLFYRLKKILGIDIFLAHFNHQLRGKAAKADEQFVRHLGQKLRLASYFGTADVAGFACRVKTSCENAARILRYRFLLKTAQKIGATRIATAHTADDQLETVLLRILRGSGGRGLRGILAEREDKVIRPLMTTGRRQILDFLKKNRLSYCEDRSNRDQKFLRNRIRHQIIPLLEKINPKLRELIVQNSRLLQDEEKWLEELTHRAARSMLRQQAGQWRLDLKKFGRLVLPIKRRVLKTVLSEIAGGKKEVSARHVAVVLDKLTQKSSWQLHLPGPVYAVSEKNFLIFQKKPVTAPKVFCYRVKLNKKNFLPEIGKTVSVGVGRRRPHLTEIRRLAPATIFLDYLKCGRRLLLRSRRPGDRFQPLGQKKPKKLKEFLIDRKIRQSEKNSYPLLSKKSGEIIAVIGLEIGERYKISGETKKILKIH